MTNEACDVDETRDRAYHSIRKRDDAESNGRRFGLRVPVCITKTFINVSGVEVASCHGVPISIRTTYLLSQDGQSYSRLI